MVDEAWPKPNRPNSAVSTGFRPVLGCRLVDFASANTMVFLGGVNAAAFLGGVNAAVIPSGSARASAVWLFACLARLRVGGQLSDFANLVSVEITPFTLVSIPITAGEAAQEESVLEQTLGFTGTEL